MPSDTNIVNSTEAKKLFFFVKYHFFGKKVNILTKNHSKYQYKSFFRIISVISVSGTEFFRFFLIRDHIDLQFCSEINIFMEDTATHNGEKK